MVWFGEREEISEIGSREKGERRLTKQANSVEQSQAQVPPPVPLTGQPTGGSHPAAADCTDAKTARAAREMAAIFILRACWAAVRCRSFAGEEKE